VVKFDWTIRLRTLEFSSEISCNDATITALQQMQVFTFIIFIIGKCFSWWGISYLWILWPGGNTWWWRRSPPPHSSADSAHPFSVHTAESPSHTLQGRHYCTYTVFIYVSRTKPNQYVFWKEHKHDIFFSFLLQPYTYMLPRAWNSRCKYIKIWSGPSIQSSAISTTQKKIAFR
jgi:hypothetical protein